LLLNRHRFSIVTFSLTALNISLLSQISMQLTLRATIAGNPFSAEAGKARLLPLDLRRRSGNLTFF
jgi:hypothetical protein